MATKKKSGAQSSNAAEKQAAQGRAKKYTVAARSKNAGIMSSNAREKSNPRMGKTVPVFGHVDLGSGFVAQVNDRVRRRDINSPGYGTAPQSDVGKIVGIKVNRDGKQIAQRIVKSTKSSVEVGRKQRAASGKKTTRKMK